MKRSHLPELPLPLLPTNPSALHWPEMGKLKQIIETKDASELAFKVPAATGIKKIPARTAILKGQ